MQRSAPPSQSRPATLVIVDDHDLARAGLRSLLAGEADLDVISEAANGREAVMLCERLRPDLVLMDVRMPDMDGLAATRALKQESPTTRVVMITLYEDTGYLIEALKAGAAGYVLKGATKREVLRLLAQGQTNREIARALQVAPGTVKGHVEHIIAKLGVSGRTQAAVRAIELGLLSPPHL